MSKWIRKGDRVVVICGNDKGKSGEVLSRKDGRVVIQGINLRKKHMRRTQESQGARIVEMEVSIDISNVSLCDKDGNKLKVYLRGDQKDKKELVYKSGAKEVVYRSVMKPA